MLTATNYPSAVFVEKSGIEICLVGDSLAMEMLHHCKAVARGAKSPFLVADMPFGSYEMGSVDAVKNAIRFIKEANMEAVKLEGGIEIAETIQKITSVGIPVMGHVGLTPQRRTSLGGFRVQGNTAKKALKLLEDAKALQEAGCFAIVLEAIPEMVAAYTTKNLKIPTIGIGAGVHTSGQVLVQQDMLGIFDRFVPRFCKQYASLDNTIVEALRSYRDEVKTGVFPTKSHCYPMAEIELEKFIEGKELSTPIVNNRQH
ncbi:117_t:CDS:2 [Ambispora leptoticha]|uniref:3-methyl-2-oxobutanoate hydroxymethyltransferase n=1 Tax=Ambispora leptoticha TaxID=144679 RepID=A0A9N8WKK1_9GLOM|nr:117_t:CDS:2 [Ambispora leptoticha]